MPTISPNLKNRMSATVVFISVGYVFPGLVLALKYCLGFENNLFINNAIPGAIAVLLLFTSLLGMVLAARLLGRKRVSRINKWIDRVHEFSAWIKLALIISVSITGVSAYALLVDINNNFALTLFSAAIAGLLSSVFHMHGLLRSKDDTHTLSEELAKITNRLDRIDSTQTSILNALPNNSENSNQIADESDSQSGQD